MEYCYYLNFSFLSAYFCQRLIVGFKSWCSFRNFLNLWFSCFWIILIFDADTWFLHCVQVPFKFLHQKVIIFCLFLSSHLFPTCKKLIDNRRKIIYDIAIGTVFILQIWFTSAAIVSFIIWCWTEQLQNFESLLITPS